jgi:hypothetical protein
MPPEGFVSEVDEDWRRSLFHIPDLDAKFLAALSAIDAVYAEQVHGSGCPRCGGALDRANYPRKPRGDLGEVAEAYELRRSFCCRRDGCRKRATPPSLRFLGRKVYIAVLVIVASAAARATSNVGRGSPRREHGVPARTVRRWLSWWQTVFALSAFWLEARAFFATPVKEKALPASLLSRFGGERAEALVKMLRFTAPITTTSVTARIAMVA